MGKNNLKSTCFLMPAWTQLTIATSASCHLPSASPQWNHPQGTELHDSAPADVCLVPMAGSRASRESARCCKGCPAQLLVALQRDRVDGPCSKRMAGTIPSVKGAPVPGTLGVWWSREGGCPCAGTSDGSWGRTAYSITLQGLATPKGFYASATW